MSKNLQHFVDNFLKGMEVGDKMQDRASLRQYRKDALDVAREKNRTAAQIHADKMGPERDKAAAYVELSRARAAQARAKAAGTGVGTDYSKGIQDWTTKWGAGVPQDQPSYGPTYVPPENTSVDAPPTGYTSSSGGGDSGDDGTIAAGTGVSDRRGGRIPSRMARGGRAGRMQALSGAVMQGAQRGVNQMNRPGTVPGAMPAAPSITRTASTPVAMSGPQGGAGTTGPGSGYGTVAAPPPQAIQTTPGPGSYGMGGGGYDGSGDGQYRRGGRARHFAQGGPVRRFADGGDTRAPNPSETGGYDLRPDAVYGRPGGTGDERPITVIGPDGKPVNPNMWDRVLPDRDYLQRQGVPTEHRAQTEKIGSNLRAGVGTRHVPTSQYGDQQGPTGGDVVIKSGGPDKPFEMPDPGKPDHAPWPQQTAKPKGAAIDTRWKPLRDQTRTAAYDPEKNDLFDPENIHAVDEHGQVKTALAGATEFADKTFHQKPSGVSQGLMNGQESGLPTGQPDPKQQELQQRGKAALFSGVGAADQKMMEQIFQKVDPTGQMPMDQKMQKAVAAVHAFHMQNGNKEDADKSAFEVAQYANSLARNHATNAIKMIQSGDHQGAINSLIAGYNTLPDGHTASYEKGNIVLRDPKGNVAASYVLDERAMKNIALGMATGQLGWDVIRMGGQNRNLPANPPQGGRPSIGDNLGQPGGPSTAPVGPGGPMPGAPQGAPPGQPPPIQQVAQPSAAPAGPAPTPAAPPAQTPPPSQPTAPPAAPPAPPPAPPPATTPAPASQPTAPPPAQTPPPPPQATAQPKPPPPAQTTQTTQTVQPAKPPATTQPAQPTKPAVDTTQTPVTKDEPKKEEAKPPTQAEINKVEAEYWKKDPYAPEPGVSRTIAQEPKEEREILTALKGAREDHTKMIQQMMLDAQQKGIMTTKQGAAYVNKVIAARNKEFDDFQKGVQGRLTEIRKNQQQQDQYEQEKALAPRHYTPQDLSTAQTDWNNHIKERTTDAGKSYRGTADQPEGRAQEKVKYDFGNSVLRYAKTPKDLAPLNRVARGIWEANGNMPDKEAMDVAIAATSIMRPDKDDKPKVGANRQSGVNGTTFTVRGNLRRGYDLKVLGKTYHLDANTYQDLVALHKQNGENYTENKEKLDKEAKTKKNMLEGISTLIPNRIGGKFGTGVTLGR